MRDTAALIIKRFSGTSPNRPPPPTPPSFLFLFPFSFLLTVTVLFAAFDGSLLNGLGLSHMAY